MATVKLTKEVLAAKGYQELTRMYKIITKESFLGLGKDAIVSKLTGKKYTEATKVQQDQIRFILANKKFAVSKDMTEMSLLSDLDSVEKLANDIHEAMIAKKAVTVKVAKESRLIPAALSSSEDEGEVTQIKIKEDMGVSRLPQESGKGYHKFRSELKLIVVPTKKLVNACWNQAVSVEYRFQLNDKLRVSKNQEGVNDNYVRVIRGSIELVSKVSNFLNIGEVDPFVLVVEK